MIWLFQTGENAQQQENKGLGCGSKTYFRRSSVGEMKIGDLSGVQVYKYRSENQQMLLAYEVTDRTLCLYALGSHQNFYRDLKKYLHG